MDAADVLYGVSMGGDGVTKVVSRRLPREVAEDEEREEGQMPAEAAAPPPFAGVAEEGEDEDDGRRVARPGLIGEQPPQPAAPRRLGRSGVRDQSHSAA